MCDLSEMTFKETCALLGGPHKVNRILGLKDKKAADIFRAIQTNSPRPVWRKKLKEYAKAHGETLIEFSESY